ncbi:MAG: hypothetical protein C4318_07220 [Acidimicrobiia bacterium]
MSENLEARTIRRSEIIRSPKWSSRNYFFLNARTKLTFILVMAIVSILGLQGFSFFQERRRAIDTVRAQAESAATAAAIGISAMPERRTLSSGDAAAATAIQTALLRAQTVSSYVLQTALVIPRPPIEGLDSAGDKTRTGDVVASVGEPTSLLASGEVRLDLLPLPQPPRFSDARNIGSQIAAVAVTEVDDSREAYVVVIATLDETITAGRGVAILLGVAAVATLIFLVVVSRGFTRRLEKLAEAAKRLGEGDLSYRVDVEGRDEIAALGEAFNRMAEAVQSNRVALAEAVSDLARASAELEKQVDENRRLLEQTVGAVDEERRRLATELHDSTIQSLHSAAMQAEYLEMLIRRGRVEDAAQSLSELTKRLRDATDELRRILFDLRPPTLDRGGLLSSLENRLREAAEIGQVRCTLEVAEGLEIPQDKEAVIYRFCQEAIANAVKHSSASTISVRMWKSSDTLRVEVKDDGKGFRAEDQAPPGHFGLAGMRERAKMAGGRVEIRSAPGQGTRVELILPVGGGGRSNTHEPDAT